jgi:carbonic anhydrase
MTIKRLQRLAQVIQVDPASPFLSKARHFFRYEGSLTTPPCSEVVEWNVFAAPVAVAQSDIGLRQGLRSRQAFELPSM